MEVLPDIRTILTLFEYPLVNSMTDDEFFDIFHLSNRCFLISWILKLLDTSYETLFENNDELVLGNLVYELGFCCKTEKEPFMKCTLDVVRQLLIIQNMLNYLKDVKHSSSDDIFDVITPVDIEKLKTKDLNLFPKYGAIKLSDVSENIDSPEEKESGLLNDIFVFEESIQDIYIKSETIQEDLPEIKNVSYKLDKVKDVPKEDICFNPDSVDILQRCNVNLKTILQFIQDVKTVQEFDDTFAKLKAPNWNNYHQDFEDLMSNISDSLKFTHVDID